MADDPALALQKGVLARLKAVTGVTALVGQRVYAEPSAQVDLPYIRWGNVDVAPSNTDRTRGQVVTFSIEAHARQRGGRAKARRVLWAVQTALDRQDTAIAVAGFDLVAVHFQTSTVARAADGKTYEGVAVFEARIDAGTF